MGIMATPGKRRKLLLCAGPFLCSVLAYCANPAQSKSWFDQRLAKKTQTLAAHVHAPGDREHLITLALLDELYDLREHVPDPFQVDSTFARIIEDVAVSSSVRAEAGYLAARIKGS